MPLTDTVDHLKGALADRYVLAKELGRGGMATVYLARDIRHKRLVALKVLLPEIGAVFGTERFQREVETAAGLQHPHILPLFDSGQTGGLLWYTMPYIEGESLRGRLKREVQLPVEDAIRLSREVAEALDYAHRHGVVHRDIKPDNILLSEGNALVADFGIAKAVSSAGGEAITQTGTAVGTPAYMSPEQASPGAPLDGRSDIYSLGCVLYEMLAGEPPFTGPSSQAVIARHCADPPRSLRVVRPGVSIALERTVERALAKVPADRFQNAGEFARALAIPVAVAPDLTSLHPTLPVDAHRGWLSARAARLALAGLALGTGAVALVWQRAHHTETAVAPVSAEPMRLAVLPFEDLGHTTEPYFAEGIAGEIRGKLASVRGITVIASTSSNQYRNTTKAPRQIAQELGVQYLLVGHVQWDNRAGTNGKVRVSPELVEAATGATKWQQAFDAPLTDVFKVQAEIAGQVAEALNVALGVSALQRLAEQPTANLAAYDAFLQGEAASQGFAAWDPPSVEVALSHYERAVALDSTFAPAWTQLARARALLYFVGTPSPALAEGARFAATRAQTLAPGRPEARLAWGSYLFYIHEDFAGALQSYEAGLRVAPTNVDLITGAATAEGFLGRWEAAIQHFRHARTIDPRAVRPPARLARALLWSRRWPEARQAADQALALSPANLDMLNAKLESYLGEGDLAGARAVLRTAPKEVDPTALVAYVAQYWNLVWVLDDAQQDFLLRLRPTSFDDNRAAWATALAQAYWLRGDEARARVYADSARLAWEQQLRGAPQNAELHASLGVTLAYLGQKGDAVREGERAAALGPVAKDHFNGPYVQHQVARIYLLVGEHDKALDRLEILLKTPYELSPGWLRIDPTFAPLRGNPRFERLAMGK